MSDLTPAQRRLHKAALQFFAERGVTQINVRELAQAAGIARGTVYNNVSDLDGLFAEVAAQLSSEMSERVREIMRDIQDPALRIASSLRCFIRRAHEEPHWGRFICRFGLNHGAVEMMWTTQPSNDLREGLDKGRFQFIPEQLVSVVALLAGTTLGAIFLVLEGRKTWRDAGADAAEFFLTGIGVARDEARALAKMELPVLPA